MGCAKGLVRTLKIGILTFHRAYNYGAILQAYALQKKLKRMGAESEIIDYMSMEKRAKTRLFCVDKKIGLKGNLVKFVKDCYRSRKNTEFDNFMAEEMLLSPERYATFDQLKELDQQKKYDRYIVGSDQVWNPKNNLRDPAFLLSFVSDSSKKCSYAASIGSAKFDQDIYALYEHEIKKFQILTVREESAIREYGFLRDNNATVVIDPTLLLTKSDYEDIASSRILSKGYAFLYTISEERNLRKFAGQYCKDNGILLVDSKKSGAFFKHSSPRDFLSFIQHADCVFTNSFHGTALSIILEKPFVTEVQTKNGLNNRSNDLMTKLGLQDRDIDNPGFASRDSIDYKDVKQKLDKLRNISEDIIKEIIVG